jgi:hypothetical protein
MPSPTPLQRLEVLKQARSLIAAGFCQGDFAQTSDGTPVEVGHPDAAKFCAAGARLRACAPSFNPDLVEATYDDLTHSCYALFGTGAISVNDERGQEAVLLAYDGAIERVTAELS